jgi:hypothetical protein
MHETDSDHGSGFCPVCQHIVSGDGFCVGMWDGVTKDGKRAGGGIHEARCPGCGCDLVAHSDVRNEPGELLLKWELKEG